MKGLRFLVFLMAVGGFPAFLCQASGQQEVDPDHFDQSAAKAIPARKANAEAAAPVYSHSSQTRLASKHTGGRVTTAARTPLHDPSIASWVLLV
jgi:hypothetical protein